jgi:hypothetical protein
MKLTETLSSGLKKALYQELQEEFETADIVKLTLELSKLTPEKREALLSRIKDEPGQPDEKAITDYLAEKFPEV